MTCQGQLMVIGGMNEDGYLDSCEGYDSLVQKWERRLPMNHARSGCGVAIIDAESGKQIWCMGGGTAEDGESRQIEVYELLRKKWQICRDRAGDAPQRAYKLSENPFDSVGSFDNGVRPGRSVVVPSREGVLQLATGRRPKAVKNDAVKAQLNPDGMAYSMGQEQQSHDHLELHRSMTMQPLYAQHGDREVRVPAATHARHMKYILPLKPTPTGVVLRPHPEDEQGRALAASLPLHLRHAGLQSGAPPWRLPHQVVTAARVARTGSCAAAHT